jgi:hypothetical protein
MKAPIEKSVAGILGTMLAAILLAGFIQGSQFVLSKLCDVRNQITLLGR